MASWDSFHSKVLDRKKLMDEVEEGHRAYDAGEIQSWDLDGIRNRCLPRIHELSKALDEEYWYLFTRTSVQETLSVWRLRMKDKTLTDLEREAMDYYTNREKRKERARGEAARLQKLADQKAAREAKKLIPEGV